MGPLYEFAPVAGLPITYQYLPPLLPRVWGVMCSLLSLVLAPRGAPALPPARRKKEEGSSEELTERMPARARARPLHSNCWLQAPTLCPRSVPPLLSHPQLVLSGAASWPRPLVFILPLLCTQARQRWGCTPYMPFVPMPRCAALAQRCCCVSGRCAALVNAPQRMRWAPPSELRQLAWGWSLCKGLLPR